MYKSIRGTPGFRKPCLLKIMYSKPEEILVRIESSSFEIQSNNLRSDMDTNQSNEGRPSS